MAHDTLLTYPDFNETITIYNDSSESQLGPVIIYKGKPVAFYSRKLADSQKGYTVTYEEILIIVKTLK